MLSRALSVGALPCPEAGESEVAQPCACYVINLDRSPERLARMDTRLRELRFPYTRVPGTDGRALTDAGHVGPKVRNRYYKALIAGEIACYLSHVSALRRFIDDGACFALILEDDAVLPEDIQSVIDDAIRLRQRGDAGTVGMWDVLKLQNSRRRRVTLAKLAAGRELVEYGFSVPISAAAAVWTREGAARFLARFRGVSRPIDCDLQHPWEFGLKILSVHPPLVRTEGVSTIGSRKKQRSRFHDKLAYEVRRIWPKLHHFVAVYGVRGVLQLLWRR